MEGWQGHLEEARPDAPLTSDQLAALLHGVAGVVADEGGQRCIPYDQAAAPRPANLPPPPVRPDLVRLERTENGVRWVGYYRFRHGSWKAVPTICDLEDALEGPSPEGPIDVSLAQQQFEMDLRHASTRQLS